jgi:hypothetical protein
MDTQTIQFLICFGGVLLLLACLYLIPSIIAFYRKCEYRWIILIINVVFGATLLGWFGALIFSIVDSPKSK